MKYKLLAVLSIAIVIILVAFFISSKTNLNNEDNNLNKVTLAELNTHSKMEDCWISYKGKVYDITNWLPKHPGTAQAILPYCGTAQEFEDAFTEKHGTSKAGLLMKVGTFMGDFENKGDLQ